MVLGYGYGNDEGVFTIISRELQRCVRVRVCVCVYILRPGCECGARTWERETGGTRGRFGSVKVNSREHELKTCVKLVETCGSGGPCSIFNGHHHTPPSCFLVVVVV